MAKFKKDFWRERSVTTEEGKVVEIPEPEWYSKQKDPVDYKLGGYKGFHDPRPVGALIPNAKVGEVEMRIKDAYKVFCSERIGGIHMKYEAFKVSLINGTTFKTMRGIISK